MFNKAVAAMNKIHLQHTLLSKLLPLVFSLSSIDGSLVAEVTVEPQY